MFEAMAKFFQAEFIGAVQTVADSHLVIIADVFVDLSYVVFVREGVRDSLVEYGFVVRAV